MLVDVAIKEEVQALSWLQVTTETTPNSLPPTGKLAPPDLRQLSPQD